MPTRARRRGRRAIAALRSYPILGIRTNVAFLIALLEHPRFVAGDIDTGLVESERDVLLSASTSEPPPEAVAVAQAAGDAGDIDRPARDAADPWTTLRGWHG